MRTFCNILYVLLLALFSSCIHDGDDEWVERVAVGDRLPAFAVTLSDGTRYDSAEPGETVIVFFNTGCTDCQRELPRLDAQYKAGEFDGRRIVCISRAEGEGSVAAYWQANGLTLPYSAQPDRRIFDLFASAGIPRIYETDAAGIVVRVTTAD